MYHEGGVCAKSPVYVTHLYDRHPSYCEPYKREPAILLLSEVCVCVYV